MNNSTTNASGLLDTDEWKRIVFQPHIIIYFIVTGLSSMIGVVGNIMTILTFALTKALHETRNGFIVNLAAADILVTGIVMPYSIFGVIAGKAYFDQNKALCAFLASVCAPGCLASMFTICWISCTRYVYICKYSLYENIFTKRNTVLFLISIWALCFLVHLPNHLGWGDSKYSTGFQICTVDMETLSYSFFYGCCMMTAIVTTFFFYLKIYFTIRKSHLARKMVTGETGAVPSNNLQTALQNEIKLAKTSFKIFIVFVITWTPTAMLILIGINNSVPSPVYLFSVYLAHSNSAVNFFMYYVDNEIFRKGFRGVCKKIRRKSNVVYTKSNPSSFKPN